MFDLILPQLSVKKYYEAPPLPIFESIKAHAIDIWSTYSDDYGYRTEKLTRIANIENIQDNAWYIVAMFDQPNKNKLWNSLPPRIQEDIMEYCVPMPTKEQKTS